MHISMYVNIKLLNISLLIVSYLHRIMEYIGLKIRFSAVYFRDLKMMH